MVVAGPAQFRNDQFSTQRRRYDILDADGEAKKTHEVGSRCARRVPDHEARQRPRAREHERWRYCGALGYKPRSRPDGEHLAHYAARKASAGKRRHSDHDAGLVRVRARPSSTAIMLRGGFHKSSFARRRSHRTLWAGIHFYKKLDLSRTGRSIFQEEEQVGRSLTSSPRDAAASRRDSVDDGLNADLEPSSRTKPSASSLPCICSDPSTDIDDWRQ